MSLVQLNIYEPSFDMTTCTYIDKPAAQLTKEYGRTFKCPCHKFAMEVLNKKRKHSFHNVDPSNFYRFNGGKSAHTQSSDHKEWLKHKNSTIIDLKEKTPAELILELESRERTNRKKMVDMRKYYEDKLSMALKLNKLLEEKINLQEREKNDMLKKQEKIPVGDLLGLM